LREDRRPTKGWWMRGDEVEEEEEEEEEAVVRCKTETRGKISTWWLIVLGSAIVAAVVVLLFGMDWEGKSVSWLSRLAVVGEVWGGERGRRRVETVDPVSKIHKAMLLKTSNEK